MHGLAVFASEEVTEMTLSYGVSMLSILFLKNLFISSGFDRIDVKQDEMDKRIDTTQTF